MIMEYEQTGLKRGSEHFNNLISPIKEGEEIGFASAINPDAGLGPFHNAEDGNKNEIKAVLDEFLAEDAFNEYMIPLLGVYVLNRSQAEQYTKSLYDKLKGEVFASEEISKLSGEELRGKIWELLYYISKEDLKFKNFDFSREDETAGVILGHLRDFLRPENQNKEFKIEDGRLSDREIDEIGGSKDAQFKELMEEIQKSIDSGRQRYEDVKTLLSPKEKEEFEGIFAKWDNLIREISKDPNPEYFNDTRDANDSFSEDIETLLMKIAERLADSILFKKIKDFVDKHVEEDKKDVFDDVVLEDFFTHIKQSENGQAIVEYVKNTKFNDFDSKPIFSSRQETQFATIINEQIKLQLNAMEAGEKQQIELDNQTEVPGKIEAESESEAVAVTEVPQMPVESEIETAENEEVSEAVEVIKEPSETEDQELEEVAPIEEQPREKEQWELDIEKIISSIAVVSQEEFEKYYNEKDLFLYGDCRELLSKHIEDILDGHGDKETLPKKIEKIFELAKDKHAKQELIIVENGNTYLVEKHAREKEKVKIGNAERKVLLEDAEEYLVNFKSKEANKGAIEHFTGKLKKEFLGLIMWQYLKNNIVTHYKCSDEQAQEIAIEIITGQK